jgi:prephenate dehydrogenase
VSAAEAEPQASPPDHPSDGDLALRSVGTVAILGLGLIGGSLARELAGRGVAVLAGDRDPAAMAAARAEGVAREALEAPLEGLCAADVVVLAVPVAAAGAVLAAAAPHLRRAQLVTDVGSTKRGVVRAAAHLGLGERFVGSHPLAGDHHAGWGASRAGLFQGRTVYLCPTPSTSPAALALAESLWRAVGGRSQVMDAAAHDRLLARTSHLPQLLSTALALALDDAGCRPDQLGPGGQDMARLAASSPEMWSGIAAENADELSPAIAALQARLAELRDAIEGDDPDAVRRLLERAREWRG